MHEALMRALETSWLGDAVRGSEWVFPALETIHFVGLCILMGALLVVDLRLIGLYRQMPVRDVLKFTPWAIFGFAINLASGVAFVASDPFNYLTNPAFWVKMVLVVLAGINVIWFELAERRHLNSLGAGDDTAASTKATAALSLTLWVAIITAGRLLPQFGANG